MANIENIILQIAAERKKETAHSIADQRKFLEYAMKVIPTLESVKLTSPGMKLYSDETTEVTTDILGGLIFAINQFLGSTNFANVENGWKYLDVDTLLDGLKAINFYTNIANNCPNLEPARNKLLAFIKTKIEPEEINKRLSEIISRAVNFINSKDKIFVAYNENTDKNIPLIAGGGYAWVFTEKAYADEIVKSNPNVPVGIKEYSLTEFKEYISTWEKYGLAEFDLNVGTDDNNIEVPVNSLCELPNRKLLSAMANHLMIRCQQCRGISGMESVFARMWVFARMELAHSAYLIPMGYEDDPIGPIKDYNVHVTQRASSLLLKMQLEKQLGTSLENHIVQVNPEDAKDNPLIGKSFEGYTSEPVPFYGAEKYMFATTEGDNPIQIGKKMCLQTIVNNGQNFIPLFTDMESLHAVYGDKVRVGIFTWEDVCERLNDSVKNQDGSIGTIQGIVFNPGLVNFVLSLTDVENINHEKNKLQEQPQTQQEQIQEQYSGIPKIKKLNSLCNASFILGLISLLLDFTPITGILSVIFGIIGKKQAKAKKEDGSGKATVGIVMGAIGFVFKLLVLVFLLMN